MRNTEYRQDVSNNQNKFVTYLVLGITQLICCCPIAGIITIIFAVNANSDYKSGNMKEYESKTKACKITLIIGLIVGIIATVFVMLLGLLPLLAVSWQ